MSNDFLQIQAVIFDMDGVLFLSNDCHERAFKEVLASIGITRFSYASIAGMRTDEGFRKILRENGKKEDEYDLEHLVALKRRKALDFLEREGEIVPESKELISRLRKNYRLVLASSASPQTVDLFLKKSTYGDAFEFCLNGSDVTHAKPAPDIYLLALEKLGLLAEQCVVVEDSKSGAEAALAAHIPVIGLSDKDKKEEFRQFDTAVVLSSLSEIGRILKV